MTSAAREKPPVESVERIDDSASLARACARWRDQEALGIDTEFVRERTYYPILGLIQVSTPGQIALIDPLGDIDLSPLREILTDPSVLKVLHSGDQDIEVFSSSLDVTLHPLFDTQIAAELVGRGGSLGYAALVDRLFGIELEKGQTRTDWTQRPLTDAQVGYAAADVRWLLPARDLLIEELEGLGRKDWHDEEVGRLLDQRLSPYQPKRPTGLDARSLAAFEALHAWREKVAQERDLPRSFVLPDAAITPLAKQRPRSRREIESIEGLRTSDLRRHGRTLLAVLDEVARRPESSLPEARQRPRLSVQRHRELMKRLKAVVAAAAEASDLPATLLASRRVLSELLDRVVGGDAPSLPISLRGWRRTLVGDRLLEALEAAELPTTSRP